MRHFALLLLLCGCGSDGDERRNGNAGAEANRATEQAYVPPPREDVATSQAAAEALRTYYAHIAGRDWAAAFAMRERQPGLSLDRFTDNFERYADYRATVGVPTGPAVQDGTIWVQVPVQLYGRMRDGSPFGSVGTVTMKRRSGERSWRVAG